MKFVIDTLGADKGIDIFIQGALKAQKKIRDWNLFLSDRKIK